MFKAVHVPSRTVAGISAETVVELCQIDNVVGSKEASGDLGQAARIEAVVKKYHIVHACL